MFFGSSRWNGTFATSPNSRCDVTTRRMFQTANEKIIASNQIVVIIIIMKFIVNKVTAETAIEKKREQAGR